MIPLVECSSNSVDLFVFTAFHFLGKKSLLHKKKTNLLIKQRVKIKLGWLLELHVETRVIIFFLNEPHRCCESSLLYKTIVVSSRPDFAAPIH